MRVCACAQYLIDQVFLRHFDGILLGPVAIPLIHNLFRHELFQDEQQELIVISPEGKIPGKGLWQEGSEKKPKLTETKQASNAINTLKG